MAERPRELRTLERPGGLFVGTEAALEALARGDERVMLSRPRPGPGGRLVTNVRLASREELRLPGEHDRARPGPLVLAAVAAGVALGVALALVVAEVGLVWVAAHLAVIAGVVAVMVAGLYGVTAALTRCPGLHCVGCRH